MGNKSTGNVERFRSKEDRELQGKIDSIHFPEKCPCCGWKKETGRQMVLMLKTIYRLQDAIYPVMCFRDGLPHDAPIDLNKEARDRNQACMQILREYNEEESKL